jgi:hypothetical protein
MSVHDLTIIQQNITDLYQQVNCIKNGDCCGGGDDTTLYDRDGIIETTRIAQITDTFEYADLNTTNIIHTFDNNGNIWFSQNQYSVGVGIDKTDPLLAKFHIKSVGATIATKAIHIQNSSDSVILTQNDAGEFSVTSNSSGSFGHRLYSFGSTVIGSYVLNSTDVAQNTYAFLASNNSPNAPYSASIVAEIGNALVGSVGVFGGVPTGLNDGYYGNLGESYQAGVKGNSYPSGLLTLDNYFGGYFTAGKLGSFNDNDITRLVGTYGEASSRANATTVITAIGGLFRTIDNTPAGPGNNIHMAINVPVTENEGNVVFGSDTPTVNKSMLEVTGFIEAVGAGSTFVLENASGTRVKFVVDASNNITAVNV